MREIPLHDRAPGDHGLLATSDSDDPRAPNISITKRGDTVVLDIGEQLIVRSREQLKQAVVDEVEKGERSFLIDFGRTGYIDSSGLGVLIAISKQIETVGGELLLANLNADLRSLFELTKLDTLFRIIEGPMISWAGSAHPEA